MIKFFSLAVPVMYFILRHSLVFTFLPSFLFLLLHFPTPSRCFCLSFVLCCCITPGFGTNCSLPSFSLTLYLPLFWSGENEWKTRTCAACTSTFAETENVCFVQCLGTGTEIFIKPSSASCGRQVQLGQGEVPSSGEVCDTGTSSYFHSIIEWLGLEGTLKVL